MRHGQYNPKRKLAKADEFTAQELTSLAQQIGYGGNPEHKMNPGDFGLNPPSGARPGKSLCDAAGVFTRAEALRLLQQGVTQGLISNRREGKWPKNIWAVIVHKGQSVVLEAQLESVESGTYHGYPMQPDDPLCDEIKKRWNTNHEPV